MPSRAPRTSSPPPSSSPVSSPISLSLRIIILSLSFLCLTVGLFAAGTLAFHRLTDHSIPGCGPGAACSSLDTLPLGSLGGMYRGLRAFAAGTPLLDVLTGTLKIEKDQSFFPTSLLGVAFYLSMLVGLIAVIFRRFSPPDLRLIALIARILAAWSIFYLIVILVSQKYCQYCIVSHTANLTFWLSMEFLVMPKLRLFKHSASKAAAHQPRRSAVGLLIIGLSSFAIASGVLGAIDAQKQAADLAKSAALAQASRDQLIAAANQAKAAQQSVEQHSSSTPPADPFGSEGFTGRWRIGPAQAVARIVIISDYQCHQCRRIEGEAFAILKKYPDKVSISAIHYPLCADCNRMLKKEVPGQHLNACWAARAAEAAAIIAGSNAMAQGLDPKQASNDAFWNMHRWLFSVGGSFTDQSFPDSLAQMGYDYNQFIKIMKGDYTLSLVKKDIEIAPQLGLTGTPMVFVNGVELKGWESPRALELAVDAVINANPPAADARNDRPPLARQKYIEDWRFQPAKKVLPATTPRSLGKPNSPVQIVVFGDTQEPNTIAVDKAIREMIATGKVAYQYTFRQFPANKNCNPVVDREAFPYSCLASRAALAAGQLGGDDAFWAMHQWLAENPTDLTPDKAAAQAATLSLDPQAFLSLLNDAQSNPQSPIATAIATDIQAGRLMGLKSIPWILVNGKRVETWTFNNENLLEAICAEAAQSQTPTKPQ